MPLNNFQRKNYNLIPGANYEDGPISKYGTFGNMMRIKMGERNHQIADSMDYSKNPEGVVDFINPMRGATLVGSKYAKLMGNKALDSLVTARKRLSKGDNIKDIEMDTGMIHSQGRMKYPVRDFDSRTSLDNLERDRDYKMSDAYIKGDKDELFLAYPDMKDTKLRISSDIDKQEGMYLPDQSKIIIGDKYKSMLAHEGMHGMQDKYHMPGRGTNPMYKSLFNEDISEIVSLKYGVDKDELYRALSAEDGGELLHKLSRDTSIPLNELSNYNRYRADKGEVEAHLAENVFDVGNIQGVKTSPNYITGIPDIDRGRALRDEVNAYLDDGWYELYD